ncbi:hypothetical protein Leryth_012893 [Lithospermum erythrorhizon]|nr:hypothetical protein Leryth_012893 [Lithospermum erythrorhizon]
MRSKIQFFISAFVLLIFINPLCINSVTTGDEGVHIGVVLDKKSSVGKIVLSCINMAVLDIHAQNGTEIVLHTRDTKGDSLNAITSSLDLLNNSTVQVMIVPELGIEASMVASLGDNAKVPILSFTSVPSASEHPYYLQIKENETAQFDAVIALLEKFNWRNIVLIYEETDGGRNSLKDIVDKLQEKTDHVVYKSFNPIVADDGMIIDELVKLKSMLASVFVVHTSHNLGAKVFLNAKRLSMMDRGYAWLVTSEMMDFFDSLDPSALDSMQFALGLKSYIPTSSELQKFTVRWKREVQYADPDLESTEFNIFGVKAYDTIWALTKVIPNLYNISGSVNARVSSNGSEILAKLSESEFRGLGGDYQFINGALNLKGYEVINVIGKQANIVGNWTPVNGLSLDSSLSNDGVGQSVTSDTKTVIWPGRSPNIPKSWLFHESGRRLQIAYPVKGGFQELVTPPTDTTEVTGFVIEVFQAAMDYLGYDVPYDLVPYKNVTGGYQQTYDEIVDSVYHKRYDAAIGDISITANRSLFVDFTIPYTELALGTIAKLDMHNRWFFLRPFDTDLWIAGGIFFISVGVVVWIIEHPINEEFQGSIVQQIGTILWFSVCTLVFAQSEHLKSNLSRFVVGIWFFVVFILTASYTAILSSTLTVQQIQATAGDNIGYQFGSSVRGNVVRNFNFNEADIRLQHYFTAEEYEHALSRTDGEGVSAIIDEMPYIRIFLAHYPSGYALVETTDTSNGFGFFFQKGSPLVLELSRAIEHLREIRKLRELEQKWYNKGKEESLFLPQQNDQTGLTTLSLSNFRGLFFISGISKVIALIIILFLFLRKRIPLKLSEVLLKLQLAVTKKYFTFRVGHPGEVASTPRVTDI